MYKIKGDDAEASEFKSDSANSLADDCPELREHVYGCFVVIFLILASLIFGG